MARVCVLLLFYIVLVYLAMEDFRERKISNWCHVAVILLALAAIHVFPEISLPMRGLGVFWISVPMAVLAMICPGSFGGGDVKLVFVCGAFLGWRLVLKGTVMAIFLAGLYSLWLIVIKKETKNVQFALGPYLSVGFIISSLALF